MKKLILLISFLFPLISFGQSMDSISAQISRKQINEFSKTLDSVIIIDTSRTTTFNIDTIRLNNGEFFIYSLSVTAIQTDGINIYRNMYISYTAVNNTAGSYFLKVVSAAATGNMPGFSITPQLLNNNTLCVVRITLNGKNTKIHYRRHEF